MPSFEAKVVDAQGTELARGEVGELWVRGGQVIKGYLNRAEATAEALRDGVLHTGDLGVMDDQGHLFIKDRKHDLIIRGGANVYPAEVERVLHDDARVAACAVFGIPDDRLGERVVGCFQAAAGATVTGEELIAHCGGQLARYKIPDELRPVDEFDRTPMGKIRKTVLRKHW